MAANSPCRLGSTLPPCSSPSLVEDGRRRSCSESQQLMPEPFQSIPAQELLKDSHCRKCGWIRKEGGGLKTWRDRYFILHKGCLYYYNRPEATTTAGKFSLGGYRLSPAPEKSSKFQWTFKLVHLQPEKRTYYFAAYSEKEMTEWMESINADMSEYCGTGRQTIIEPCTDSGEEYCYPEVEPKFSMEQLAALFGKCPLPGSGETGGSQQPTSDPVYCPPPEIDPRDILRKSPHLLRSAPPSPKPGPGKQKMGFSYMGGNRMSAGPSSLRLMRQPSPGSSPIFNRKPDLPPDVPSRQGKPLAPPKPLSRPPPPTKRATAPVLTYPSCISNSEDDDDEEGEGYLDIVPDTNPEDVANEVKQSTPSRSVQGFPDGQSFRKHHSEDVLPSSALRLDVDKLEVHYLLENKLGVYIMRESQNAQSRLCQCGLEKKYDIICYFMMRT
ncbi:SH3 domain-binding protein 2-like isoform X3 [Orbicella faveolata]|uniref:SH3 domain-binding protein 2-like isoform X3 n=1 Tax=Orbicella faveolata TaxID=48498 RepID=UPI0009E26571|nr:SH3 domain-binding protein 2-like isoform X3 [Orbicella faveolata]